MNFLKFAILIGYLTTFIACGKCDTSAECSSFVPPEPNTATCQMAARGYYYDTNSNSCKYYEGAACSQPPFELESECTPCKCNK